jgi:pyrroloquinoline-quinone synthase
VAAIYAYERQVPVVAEAKMIGLRKHYGVEDERTLEFWQVHQGLDGEHAKAERRILADADPGPVLDATREALDAWWWFLDAITED